MSVVTQNPVQEKLKSLFAGRTVKGADSFRKDALNALGNCELPNAKTEDWKYTRMAKVLNEPFTNKAGLLPDLTGFSDYTNVLVFVNGRFNFELSSIYNVKFKFTNAVYLKPLPHYSHHKNYFTALNGTYFHHGIYADAENDKTAIVHYSTGNTFSNIQHFLKSEKGKSSSYDLFFISDQETN